VRSVSAICNWEFRSGYFLKKYISAYHLVVVGQNERLSDLRRGKAESSETGELSVDVITFDTDNR
jgi:hypothetical protein